MESNIEEEKLRGIIEESVDESVKQAFKKYGRIMRMPHLKFTKMIFIMVVAMVVILGAIGVHNSREASKKVEPVENHDLTIENEGIFGFTVADFEDAILGEATRQRLLVVEEQEVYDNATITDTGLFNWGVFNKKQVITIHGTGQYTIDLSQVTAQDISLDEDTYELTIRIPHAELQKPVKFDPSQTEIGDTEKGWLVFGDIKLTQEQQKAFEEEACKKLEEKLSEEERFKEADRFAKLSAYETYQPIVKAVSPAYKVVIEFK